MVAMDGVASTSSIGEVRITLRDDIQFRPQQYGGESCYVIEDATNSTFFRIGIPEYTLISLFDGRHSIRDAMHEATSLLGREAFTEQDAAAISRWLVESGLAKTYTSAESKRLHKMSKDKDEQTRRQSTNPIITKIPVFCPERVLDRFTPFLMWLTTPVAFVLWIVALIVAGHQLITHWSTLDFDATQVLSPNNWLWLAVTWIVLKFIHETFHALVCRKYSGEVREAGVVLIALAPIFYVDVTSSWRFPSKWQRIFVAAAGMYAEIFIGAIAALVWIHTGPGTINQIAFNVLVLSTITTVLFNANPLMRFDGYYMLSDFVEIPNLAPQGQQYLSYLGKRYYYGIKSQSPVGTWRDGWFIRLYGVAAMLWRILITLCIGIAAAQLFHGAGLAIVIVAGALWVLIPLFQNAKFFAFGHDHEQPKRVRCALLTAALIALIWTSCNFSPWPFAVKAPAVIDYQPRGIVRTETAGFVAELFVEPGEMVQTGQLLAVLESAELQAEVRRLQAMLEASQTRVRITSQQGDVNAQQFEHQTRENIRSQLVERLQQLQNLEVRAPMAGKVVSDELDSLQGKYLSEGHELLVIGDEARKEIVLSIAQEDADLFADYTGNEVTVKMRGGKRERISLPMGSVQPGASTRIEYDAISAAAGGCVAVRPAATSQDVKWEFIEPRLMGTITLPSDTSASLRAGQLAMVRLPVARSTLGQGIYRYAEKWMRSKWRQVQGS